MSNVMGKSVNRQEGRAKVTGSATYAAEHQISGLVYGALITATVAKGRIKTLHLQEAQASPGVLHIATAENIPPLSPVANDWATSQIYESRLPLADQEIHYPGQIIGLVVADTPERARHAATLVQVEYETDTPLINPKSALFITAPRTPGLEQGDTAKSLETAECQISATYTTAMELHAMMEPHAIIAHWQDNNLTVYEPSQWVALHQQTYATLFGIPPEQVRVVTPYIGGAFGAKAFPWPHGILCTAVAREIQRPLKLVLPRQQMTMIVGNRSATEQHLKIGATADGQLLAIEHHAKSQTSPVNPTFAENCIAVTPVMYATPNLSLKQEIAILNVGMPTYMRGPGETPGMFALESAMDELAWTLGIDPVELRLKNATPVHQRSQLPFSAKHFADCLQVGAEQFGWKDRPQQPRSLTRDGKFVGWGMAAATFPGLRFMASATVRLFPDSTVQVLTSANDVGTGAYTVIAISAAETLNLPVENIRVEIGDSRLPNGGLAGGSMMTATLAPAVVNVCEELLKQVNANTTTEALQALQESGQPFLEATGSSQPGTESREWAFQSWGAHFCEVEVDEPLGRVQVKRWVSVMDIGRVINAKAAASQIRGAVIMGIGDALMEECQLDPHLGLPIVYDLATYHIPVHADIPRIQVSFVGEPDRNFNPVGARGCGEIGITGVAAAIANGIYHATGKRLRDLPMTPDQLLGM
ncbi:Xanthine dehydrogenase, molybdenum binding subunit apoprotein [Planktothrix sp. PCC 11201]|uniref:xanthine dehydrogenase family protein molybdopterin-binding subunit n=1 Tax=Planktothrix sp. PCC 11201 TaxID=1729650 RepID=UPI000914D080|nr:xanthine dehydrogenase family protein molybdopterin-binding subunit [Planktothrix sp. PCC 11201]SKB11118.1 Xanthine dehydrogenase, molybdenum binding subunit apoprotein [Planktothrix sp. PCC 11201]